MSHKKVKKAAPKSQANNNQLLLVGILALVIVAVVGGVFVFAGGDTTADTAEVVQNLNDGVQVSEPQLIGPQTYQTAFAESNVSHQLIDVRTREEFASGHIVGAINIPVEELAGRLSEVSPNTPVVVYCRSGNRSAQAADLLDSAGFNNIYDLGGVLDWTGAGFSLQR